MITNEIVQDKIEIVGEYNFVNVRTSTITKRDGIEVSRSFHRHVVMPNSDITGESPEVQAVCVTAHTDEIKAAYAAHIAAVVEEIP